MNREPFWNEMLQQCARYCVAILMIAFTLAGCTGACTRLNDVNYKDGKLLINEHDNG